MLNEAFDAFLLLLKPFLDTCNTLLNGFFRSDLKIFGVPYYIWVLGGFFAVYVIGMVLDLVGGE